MCVCLCARARARVFMCVLVSGSVIPGHNFRFRREGDLIYSRAGMYRNNAASKSRSAELALFIVDFHGEVPNATFFRSGSGNMTFNLSATRAGRDSPLFFVLLLNRFVSREKKMNPTIFVKFDAGSERESLIPVDVRSSLQRYKKANLIVLTARFSDFCGRTI